MAIRVSFDNVVDGFVVSNEFFDGSDQWLKSVLGITLANSSRDCWQESEIA